MGWYPDPTDTSQERYWEGTRWTHNVREPLEPVVTQEVAPAPDPRTARPGAGVGDKGSAAPIALIETTTTDGVQLAGFTLRILARLIDMVAAGLLTLLVGYRFVGQVFNLALEQSRLNGGRITTTISPEISQRMETPSMWLTVTFVICLFAIELLFGGLFGRTPGKFAVGLKQVPVGEGLAKKAGWAAAIRRSVVILAAGVIDLTAGPFATMMTCLWMQFSRRRQTIQDVVGRTQVVNVRAEVVPVAQSPAA